MTVEEAVAEHLSAWPAVSALVGTRVYQLLIPQSATLPAVRVQVVDEPLGYHLRGRDGARRARVQIDSYADGSVGDAYSTAAQLSEAIEDALSNGVVTVGSPASVMLTGSLMIDRRSLFEPGELRQVRMLQEFIVWSKALN